MILKGDRYRVRIMRIEQPGYWRVVSAADSTQKTQWYRIKQRHRASDSLAWQSRLCNSNHPNSSPLRSCLGVSALPLPFLPSRRDPPTAGNRRNARQPSNASPQSPMKSRRSVVNRLLRAKRRARGRYACLHVVQLRRVDSGELSFVRSSMKCPRSQTLLHFGPGNNTVQRSTSSETGRVTGFTR